VPALIFNIAKGKFAYYASLPAANDALAWILFQRPTDPTNTCLSDAVIMDAPDLPTTIAAGAVEATFTGYARVLQTAATITTDNNDNSTTVDVADVVWSPRSAQAIQRIGCYYVPDTTAPSDAALIPLFTDDFVLTTPTSGTTTYVVNAAGWGKAQ